jgi:ribose transport system substrate-binding protein
MLKRTFVKTLMAGTVIAGIGLPALAQSAWDGPTTGPKAADGKTIVVLAADLKNGGILGVTTGVEEAAAKIGWTVRVLDGAGSVQGRTAAVGQALALQPNGIIINGFDAVEQQAALEGVAAASIPMVSWHSGPKIGCDAPGGIFANVSTDAMTVSEEAAKWAVADAGGKPGVVIFTDSTYQIAIDKADRIKATVEAMGGTVLEYVDTPIADTSTRMGPLTTSLLQKYGASWTHALAINDIYFDFMGPALAAAGVAPDANPKVGIGLPAHPHGAVPVDHRRRTPEPAGLAAGGRIEPRDPGRGLFGLHHRTGGRDQGRAGEDGRQQRLRSRQRLPRCLCDDLGQDVSRSPFDMKKRRPGNPGAVSVPWVLCHPMGGNWPVPRQAAGQTRKVLNLMAQVP